MKNSKNNEEFRLYLQGLKPRSFTLNLYKLGLRNAGGNARALKERIATDNLDITTLEQKRIISQRRYLKKEIIPLEKILVNGSEYNRCHLKRRLIKEGLLINKCDICELKPQWNGKSLTMVLDHKNGKANDNRIENLRLICPNCNSQTSTFAGRNTSINIIKNWTKKCKKCGKEITIFVRNSYCHDCDIENKKCPKCGDIKKGRQAKLCLKCAARKRRKAERPDIKQLTREVTQWGYCKTGRKYGVSDNAIRKWLGLKK